MQDNGIVDELVDDSDPAEEYGAEMAVEDGLIPYHMRTATSLPSRRQKTLVSRAGTVHFEWKLIIQK